MQEICYPAIDKYGYTYGNIIMHNKTVKHKITTIVMTPLQEFSINSSHNIIYSSEPTNTPNSISDKSRKSTATIDKYG